MRNLILFILSYSYLLANGQSFAEPLANPFGLDQTGNFSSPAIGDLDGDGDGDVLAGFGSGDFAWFQNKGSASNPFFAGNVVNPFGLSKLSAKNNPALADLDADGDLDLLCGSDDGLFYFENKGTTQAPQFASALSNPFAIIPPQGINKPDFADIDRDGDWDLFLGASDGNIYWFENTGTPSSPQFAAPVKNPFGLQGVQGSAAIAFDREYLNPDVRAVICESDTGHFYVYSETDTAKFHSLGIDVLGLEAVGADARPSFYDLNNDGLNDILTGDASGSFHLFLAKKTSGVAGKQEALPKIYPNPATDELMIESPKMLSEIRILDLNGKILQHLQPESANVRLSLHGLAKGIYFLETYSNGIRTNCIKFMRQ